VNLRSVTENMFPWRWH